MDEDFKNAKIVLNQLEHARENGLEVEWMEAFLENMKTGQYSVIESCYHANYEWDL